MIDGLELEAIGRRAEDARSAVETVQVHTDGGLFGDIPMPAAAALFPAAVASARDVPALLAEVRRLAPASYAYGREECAEGDCAHVDEPGAECPELEYRVATFDDVKRAETLAEVVQSARRRLGEFSEAARSAFARDFAVELVADIDNALEAMEAAESAGWAH